MLKLDELQGGALAEQINYELEKIFNNIKDPNTENTKVRSLVIDLKFKPNKNRDMVEMTPTLRTKIVPATTEPTTIIVDRDFNTGKIVAKEYNGQIEGQVGISDIENGEVKNEDGKVIDLMASNNK